MGISDAARIVLNRLTAEVASPREPGLPTPGRSRIVGRETRRVPRLVAIAADARRIVDPQARRRVGRQLGESKPERRLPQRMRA